MDLEFIKREIEKYKIQYWDCRYSRINSSNILLWNKELRQIGEESFEGVGVRVLTGNGWGFSSTTKTDKESLRKIIKQAVKISKLLNRGNKKIFFGELKGIKDIKQIKGKKNIENISLEEKKNFLLEQKYNLNGPIKSIYLKYRDRIEKKIFLNSLSEIHQSVNSVYLAGGISAFDSGKSEEQMFRKTGLGGFENLKNTQEEIDNAISKTKTFLYAKNIRSGKYDVILSGGLTGLFVHEALGHAAEADHVLQDASCLKELMGKKLAGENVNILDDPTQDDFNGWGSYYYDDEGTKARKNYIILKGRLNSYLHTLETSKELGMLPTGNARAENSLAKPIARMSNTYVEKGDYSFNELIEKIKNGYLLKGFKGGETDPAGGGFQFGASESYYVKNGKIIEAMRGAGIGGKTLDTLKNIKFVENKYSEDSPGFCGKMGQRVFAGGNNPAVFVKGIVLI